MDESINDLCGALSFYIVKETYEDPNNKGFYL